jgi:hypothetical protein
MERHKRGTHPARPSASLPRAGFVIRNTPTVRSSFQDSVTQGYTSVALRAPRKFVLRSPQGFSASYWLFFLDAPEVRGNCSPGCGSPGGTTKPWASERVRNTPWSARKLVLTSFSRFVFSWWLCFWTHRRCVGSVAQGAGVPEGRPNPVRGCTPVPPPKVTHTQG